MEHGHTGNVPIVRCRVLGLCTAEDMQGAGMSDGWEPPSEAECQACWDGLKAKLAAAEERVERLERAIGNCECCAEVDLEYARRRIAELEAEVKRLTDEKAARRECPGCGVSLATCTWAKKYHDATACCPDCNHPPAPETPEGKYGTVYGLRPMDHKARKHDPISPADPLERAP